MILLSYIVEAYILLRLSFPTLRFLLPPVAGDIKHLRPALFSICTHLVASNEVASRSVAAGGIGYTGVLTTLEGMTQEIVEWNHAHVMAGGKGVSYQSSVSLADDIQKAAATSVTNTNGTHEGTSRVLLR